MNRALAELLLRSLRGRAVRGFRLLRQPRYLVGLLAGILYFGGVLWGPFLDRDSWRSAEDLLAPAGVAGQANAPLAGAGAAMAGVVVALSWLLLPGRSPIRLSGAEIHTLLPAPIPRRAILQYSLYRGQAGILIAVLILTGISRPDSWSRAGILALGLWSAFTLWDLHGKARHLTRLRIAQLGRGLRPWLRAGVMLAALTLLVLAGWELRRIGAALFAAVAQAGVDMNPGMILGALAAHEPLPAARILLAPLRWVLEPWIGGGSSPWAWGPVLGLLVLHHEWVVRSAARFEDETLARERRRSRRRALRARGLRWVPTGGRGRVPFPLPPRGRPEVAITWKNLIVAPRPTWIHAALGIPAATALGLLTVALLHRVTGSFFTIVTIGLQVAIVAPFLVTLAWPRSTAGDLRHHAEWMRTWPIPGARLVGAQVLASVTAGLVVHLLGIGFLAGAEIATRMLEPADPRSLAGLFSPGYLEATRTPAEAALVFCALGGTIFLAAVSLLLASLESLGVLLFPGWLLLLRSHGGTVGMGHGLLTGILLLLVLVVGLLPAGILLAVVLGMHAVLDIPLLPVTFPPLVAFVCLPLFLEAALVIRWAGRAWARLDLSREILDR